MFGNKNKFKGELEEASAVIEQIVDLQRDFSVGLEEIQGAQTRMNADLNQLSYNVDEAGSFAKNNIDVAASLKKQFSECQEEMEATENKYHAVCDKVKAQYETSMELVEGNKHFTSISKNLSEMPGGLREQVLSYQKDLEEMSGFSKQMGVLALNAAIEAGRLGETGKSFVLAAEEVRNYASEFERAANKLADRMQTSNEQIQKLEDEVHHLVALLKDTNVSSTKIMKSCKDTDDTIKQAGYRDFSADIADMKEQLTGIINAQEEMIKMEERNRIQISDIQEEMNMQNNSINEILQAMSPAFSEAAAFMKDREDKK